MGNYWYLGFYAHFEPFFWYELFALTHHHCWFDFIMDLRVVVIDNHPIKLLLSCFSMKTFFARECVGSVPLNLCVVHPDHIFVHDQVD